MKRFLCMFLTLFLLLSMVPVTIYAASGFTVTAPEDRTARVGDQVSVQVMAGSSTEHAYNAYDLIIVYDTSRLEYRSAELPDSNGSVLEDGDSLRIMGYGKDKKFSTPVVDLTFTVKSAGDAAVRISSAAIDKSAEAQGRNAPDAEITDETTLIRCGYTVTINGAGLSGPDTAFPDENYVFEMKDADNYTDTITVTVDGKEITPTYDETTGKYTIEKEKITGEIVITRTGKEFKVTITGEDVTGEPKAYYNTYYTFKLDRKEGYRYTIKVTIDGKNFTEYTLEDNVYTIPGEKIAGDITIKVTRTKDESGKVQVQFIGSGAKDGRGDKLTLGGVEFPFKINRKKGYTYSVDVYVSGKRSSFDYDYQLDTYYILADHVTGDITIVINKVATVEALEYITLDEQSLFLIVYNGHVKKGRVPMYDSQPMYWSEKYHAYVWLAISADSQKKVKKAAEAAITIAESQDAAWVDYSGNVNRTDAVNEEDAQLIHAFYNAGHTLDTMEKAKFLGADMNGDRKVNVRDAVAIVDLILADGEESEQ